MKPLHLFALGAVLALLAACPSKTKDASAASDESVAPFEPHVKLLRDLSVMARGKPISVAEAQKKAASIKAGKLTFDAFIDEQLDKPMGGRLAKDLVISPSDVEKDRHPLPSFMVLKKKDDVYFLRDSCDKAKAIDVLPWWGDGSDASKVRVCPDAYRPDVKGDKHGRTCGASMLAPSDIDLCGCGPRLMFCSPDREQFKKMQDEIQEEVFTTTAWVVDGDRPIEELFTMNASVRNRTTEALYRRARILAGEPETLLPVEKDFDEEKPTPRAEQIPGHHAGVLTTPALTYSSDALRGVMRNYYDYLWCAGVSSSRVTTEGIMELKEVPDLRIGDGWKELASMNICTDCHARLDYGMQFFWGYPSAAMGVDFIPANARKGEGPLYANDIKDDRGVAELSPRGFGKLVTAQPEFATCMTRKVVDHVFGGNDTGADFKAVQDVFESTHRIKPMLRAAMRIYAERATSPEAAAAAAAEVGAKKSAGAPTVTAAAADDMVKITPKLREMLDDKCMSCHDEGDAFDYNGKELKRITLAKMIDQVGFAAMPRNNKGLDEPERMAFVEELATLAFTTDSERSAAVQHFGGGLRGLPVHRFRSSMSNVNDRAFHDAKAGKGQGQFRPSSIETAVEQSQMRYSPSVAIAAAATAVRACREADEARKKKDTGGATSRASLEACIARATAPDTVVLGAIHE